MAGLSGGLDMAGPAGALAAQEMVQGQQRLTLEGKRLSIDTNRADLEQQKIFQDQVQKTLERFQTTGSQLFETMKELGAGSDIDNPASPLNKTINDWGAGYASAVKLAGGDPSSVAAQIEGIKALGRKPPERKTTTLSPGGAVIDTSTGETIAERKASPESDVGKLTQDLTLGHITPKAYADRLRKMNESDNAPKLSDVSSLRGQYMQTVKQYETVRDFWQRVKSAEDTPIGDLSMIFSYMKILDPTSVVRESEQASVSNAAGVPERVRNLYNKIADGARLTPEQRRDIRSQSGTFFRNQLGSQKQIADQFRNIASGSGIDPNLAVPNVFGAESGDAEAVDFKTMSDEELGAVEPKELSPEQLKNLKAEVDKRIGKK